MIPQEIVIPGGYWVAWLLGAVLTGFAVPEFIAIKNKQSADTLSENIRLWLHTDTPGGGWTFLGVWTTLLAVLLWLLPHILRLNIGIGTG